MQWCTSTISQLKLEWILCAQISQFEQLERSHLWVQRSFTLRSVWLWRISQRNYGQTRWLDVICWTGLETFSTFELFYLNMKFRLRPITDSPKINLISDNPGAGLEYSDCSVYTLRIVLNFAHHRKRLAMLAFILVERSYLETLAKIFIVPAGQNSWFKKTFLTMLLIVGFLMQWIQTLLSLD